MRCWFGSPLQINIGRASSRCKIFLPKIVIYRKHLHCIILPITLCLSLTPRFTMILRHSIWKFENYVLLLFERMIERRGDREKKLFHPLVHLKIIMARAIEGPSQELGMPSNCNVAGKQSTQNLNWCSHRVTHSHLHGKECLIFTTKVEDFCTRFSFSVWFWTFLKLSLNFWSLFMVLWLFPCRQLDLISSIHFVLFL